MVRLRVPSAMRNSFACFFAVAQENLEAFVDDTRPLVEHSLVGAFFSRFDEHHHQFVPNTELFSLDPYAAKRSDILEFSNQQRRSRHLPL